VDNNEYAAAIVELLEIKLKRKELEGRDTALTGIIKAGLDQDRIAEDDVRTLGLVPTVRSGGYDDGVIVLLKQKGLKGYKTQEVVDNKTVREYEQAGVLTEEELAPYKKADSFYCTLPRGR